MRVNLLRQQPSELIASECVGLTYGNFGMEIIPDTFTIFGVIGIILISVFN